VKVDLILLDWNMPFLDGLATLKRLKADPALCGIPVTMVTTEVERDRVVHAIAAGAKSYLMKPFTKEGLCAKILENLGMGL